METLIHHFKIVTEGYRVPEGECRRDRVAARRVRVLRRFRRGMKPWRVSSARRRSSRSRRRDVHVDSYVADLIAIVGLLDSAMGDTDR